MKTPNLQSASKKKIVKSAVGHISGFKPALTGPICDSCNAPLESMGDSVYVYMHWNKDSYEWRISRTTCAKCGDSLDDREMIEAIAKCELGDKINGEAHPLYNPEIVELNSTNGIEIRK